MQILACLTRQHETMGVAVAAVLCAAAALSCTLLLRGQGRARPALAAMLAGAGAWSTHFVALLAHETGLPTAYALAPTLASALVALAGSLAGFSLWAASGADRPWRRAAGGAVLGLGIAAMHYLGMAAVRLQGEMRFDPAYVLASVALAAALGAAALRVLRPDASRPRRLAGAALLVATIVSLHFTGMAGVVVWPDPEVVVPPAALPRAQLMLVVAAISAAALVAALTVLALEARLSLAAQAAEAGRLRSLADAAFEALAMLDAEGRVTDASDRLAGLAGRPRESLLGLPFESLLRPGEGGEDTAVLASGVPVELQRRTIETAAGRRTVVALRDLRDRLASESRIRHMAHHDTLTGLANRALLMQRLEEERARARRGADSFAVLCIDLDRFKPVNDVYGHAAGDRLLRLVADRLRGSLRETDTCARAGGDEFVVLQALAGQPASAQALAQRIVEALSEPFDLGEAEVSISASVGIALYPADAGSAEELLRAADVALYRVKEGGRSGYAFFQARMDQDLRRRRALEGELRQATARGEMSLAWQPQADAATGEILGFEALLRWTHPERGPVPPDVFIPVAESSGAIVQIGAWVLRTAAQEAAGWPRPLRVAVNVSALQVQQADFPEVVRRVLEESGLDPARLELEVTESLLITDTERALATLRALKALGLRVSLDDFGTGYSSLSMLRTFPFDKVKMDRSFVGALSQDGASAAMVQAILGLGRGLGLPVVAEGVESEAQARVLREARCDEIQGYLVGRPRPIREYDGLVGRDPLLAVA